MPEIGELCAEVFQELEEAGLFDPAFTWAGGSYACIPNAVRKRASLEPGGFSVDEDLVLHCRSGQFGDTLPTRGQTISYVSVTYRIDSVTTAPDQGFIRLGCVNASKGA